jgi:2-oxo-4-hydroxy-4-carboxy-5-ureidoimidazoline decarboxylase
MVLDGGDFWANEGDIWMGETRWTVADVNAWDREEFVARLGFLFEHSPWIVETAWAERPFGSRGDLHRALTATVAQAGEERRVALIRSHPDLVGRAALAGTLTRESSSEQQAAGLDPGRLTPEEIARFGDLNESYTTRFGFPFVICARENTKATILAGFAARLGNNRETEIATALAEIAKICWYRLADVVAGDR